MGCWASSNYIFRLWEQVWFMDFWALRFGSEAISLTLVS